MRVALFAALTAALLSSATAQASTRTAERPVTFHIDVPAAAFAADGEVTVQIFDAEQLRRMAQNRGCMASWDGVTETIYCPDGRAYQEVTPEVRTVSLGELDGPLSIVSRTVSPGEAYRVAISGLAADDCNAASAADRGVARRASVEVDLSEVFTTQMACLF